jgi:TolB protein
MRPRRSKLGRASMKVPPRDLAEGQRCQVWIYDIESGENALLLETDRLLLEAPNWTLQGDALILNGAGVLWCVPATKPVLTAITINAVPPLNNDHVLDPDGKHVFLSAYDDWQLYRASLNGGTAVRISGKEGPKGLFHFLHGVSPDGKQLAFVGVEAEESEGGTPIHFCRNLHHQGRRHRMQADHQRRCARRWS